MNLLNLERAVAIGRENFIGCNTCGLMIKPFTQPGWHLHADGRTYCINRSVAKSRFRRIELTTRTLTVGAIEHISALRWTGLDAVSIGFPSGVPYFTRPGDIWNRIKPYTSPSGKMAQWLKLQKGTRAGDDERFIEAWPIEGNKLDITIIIDYPKLGKYTYNHVLPDQPLNEAFSACTLGYPPWLYHISRFLGETEIWPHHHKIIWPQEYRGEGRDLLRLIALHRLTDLLGALSLISCNKFLSARILSYRARHRHDMELIKKLETSQ